MRRIRRIMCLLLAALPYFSLLGCVKGSDEADIESERIDILFDTKFETGIHLLGTSTETGRETFRKLDYSGMAKKTESPLWMMSQWNSKYDLSVELDSGRSVEKKEGSFYIYEDPSKTIRVDPTVGTIDLNYRSSVDYSEGPRTEYQPWSHMLIEQNFENPVMISDLSKLYVETDFTITQMDRKMSNAEYDPNVHAAQLLWYITLTNMSEEHGIRGDYIWFGVPLYDNRGISKSDTISYDAGTDRYIYAFSPVNYYSEDAIESQDLRTIYIRTKKAIAFKYDIYSLFEKAFRKVQKKGGLKGARFEDMAVTYMNLGWELPGTFDVDVTFRKIDIYGFGKDKTQ